MWTGIGIGIGIGRFLSSILGIESIGKKWYWSTFSNYTGSADMMLLSGPNIQGSCIPRNTE